MSKLRNPGKEDKLKISKNVESDCQSDQYVCFSFRYMTKNSDYSLRNISDKNQRDSIMTGLHNKLCELSQSSWQYLMQQRKSTGLETINYDQIKFRPTEETNLTKDSKLYVFRLDTHRGKNGGRIIGYKSSPCSVYNIIGFDIDYSAYNH